MSEALRVYKIENRGDIEKLASDIENLEEFKEFSKDKRDIPENIYKQIELIEELPKSIFCKKDIEKITSKFFKIAQIALDYRELYRLYIGKNILNIFRQDHGYKRGNYKKVWGGKEDNIILQDILENSPDIKPNDLYRALEDRYPKE